MWWTAWLDLTLLVAEDGSEGHDVNRAAECHQTLCADAEDQPEANR